MTRSNGTTKSSAWAALAMMLMLGATIAAAQGDNASPAAAPVAPAGPIRVVDADFSVGNALVADLALGMGEVVVSGESVDRIYARLQISCAPGTKDATKCDRQARAVAISGVSNGDKIEVKVKGVEEAWVRRLRLRLELRVPQRLPINVHVHDGQVRVDGVGASTKVEVDKGTIDLSVVDAEVGEFVLRAGGKVTVDVRGETMTAKGTLTGELRWVRPGRLTKVEAKADLGDVRVVVN